MTPRKAIIELLRERGADKSICPSEAARRCRPGGDWRALMDEVRSAGRLLASEGLIAVTQKGAAVDAETARGAIRYRLKGTIDDT